MTDCIDLEIGIRRDGDHYAVELRCSQPGSESDVRSGASLLQLDAAELLERAIDEADYGWYLTQKLFVQVQAEPGQPPQTFKSPREVFGEARSNAQSKEIPLHLQLFIGPNAPELHNLCWEKLCDPKDGTPLLADKDVLFSRYLSSLDWSPVRLRRKTALRALVVVANPDLSEYPDLVQINVGDELERIQASLEGIAMTHLAEEGTATLDNVIDHLREGYDILYLVCHGTLEREEPIIWLEGEEGGVERVSGHRFVSRLRKLPLRPRLVVLASCQSAGSGEETHASHRRALSALGPRLAEACIPAVVAMQGNVAMQTAAEFMPVFFGELQCDGQIDRAMAAARSQVERPGSDWWRPALFMRLKSGRIWYTPGFSSDEYEVETWSPLLRAILGDEEECFCTPILGLGLADPLFGPRREMARHWAETHRFPMAYHDREDLSQVAQYLAVHWGDRTLRGELRGHLRQALLHRYGQRLANYYAEDLPSRLHELIKVVGALDQEQDPLELYRILAGLPFPIYVTTDPSNSLEEALSAVDRPPRPIVCPWRGDIDPRYYKLDVLPSPDHPVVYYPFGSFHEPKSLVLSEDDYYDYLIGMTQNKDKIPNVLLGKLAENALLFLGFRIEERGFRVLLRSIMNLQGRSGARVSSVAAQVFPEEGYIQEPERARRYLEKYFQTARINIYWGNAEDFIRELERHWLERGGEV